MVKYKVTIGSQVDGQPETHEIRTAAKLMRSDVKFVRTSRTRTPDFYISGEFWELKSPTGNSARTIENNLRSASGQSGNVILDLTRCKMNVEQAVNRAKYFIANDKNHKIKKLLVLDKRKNLRVLRSLD